MTKLSTHLSAIGLVLFSAIAQSTTLNTVPAARKHVKQIDGHFFRFTSKLSQIIELNFTLGFAHLEGKQRLSSLLDKIAIEYGSTSEPAFKIKRFIGPNSGAANGVPTPMVTGRDLDSSEVLVLNNVSLFEQLITKDPSAAQAIEKAIRNGVGLFSNHGIAEHNNSQEWPIFQQSIIPFNYYGHTSSYPVPVYVDSFQSKHLAVESLLNPVTDSTMKFAEVQMGIDANGLEVLVPNYPVRMVRKENTRIAFNPFTDSSLAPRTTCPLRYDVRVSSKNDMPDLYRYKGGNAFACIWNTGNGKASYFPQGHSKDEFDTFNAKTGDLERYIAQLLFYLAGYHTEPCGGGVQCEGLPIVDSLDHMTGQVYGSGLANNRTPFKTTPFSHQILLRREAVLFNLQGQKRAEFRLGSETQLRVSNLNIQPGIYVFAIKTQNGYQPFRRLFLSSRENLLTAMAALP